MSTIRWTRTRAGGLVRARRPDAGYGAFVPATPPARSGRADQAAPRPARSAAGRALPAAGRGKGLGAGPGQEHLIEVRRSARRRRTVTAYREAGRTIVLIPAAFSPAEERRWVAQMVAKLQTREERRHKSLGGDGELMARAAALSHAHLDGLAEPASVRWVDNQHRRWGSCTPADRSIRLSSRLRSMPEFVVDYVLVHELVHLLEPSHDERFWTLVARYPKAERARGFLEGVELATASGATTDPPTIGGDVVD
jgi:predicted metal-dependent hydrolase